MYYLSETVKGIILNVKITKNKNYKVLIFFFKIFYNILYLYEILK